MIIEKLKEGLSHIKITKTRIKDHSKNLKEAILISSVETNEEDYGKICDFIQNAKNVSNSYERIHIQIHKTD